MARQNWKIDPTHSEIQFKVRHMMISTVTGSFSSFDASLESDADFNNANIRFEADIDSINTGVADRDGHLKSADFFDAANHPKLSFASTRFEQSGDGEFVLEGDLTIRDTTKSVKLNVEYGGTLVDPYGQTKAGFELSGKINRKDFGLTWSAVTEAGSIVVSDEVKLLLNVQLVKQAVAETVS
ncbi:MAG: YceI family protein [Bacteroidota bacterium]